jgi:hypothetical protein
MAKRPESQKSYREQLGMPLGTATHKLRKMVILELLKQLKRSNCCRCKLPIQTAEEMSMDHIEPWRNLDVSKFWDVNNIGFSHKACNVPHVYRNGHPVRETSPQGFSWCSTCKEHKPITEFSKNKRRANGFANQCKLHRRRYK